MWKTCHPPSSATAKKGQPAAAARGAGPVAVSRIGASVGGSVGAHVGASCPFVSVRESSLSDREEGGERKGAGVE